MKLLTPSQGSLVSKLAVGTGICTLALVTTCGSLYEGSVLLGGCLG